MKITKKRLQEIVLEELQVLKETPPGSPGVQSFDTETVKDVSGGSAVASRMGTQGVQSALNALQKALAVTPAARRAQVVAGIIAQLTDLQGDAGSAARVASAVRAKAQEDPNPQGGEG